MRFTPRAVKGNVLFGHDGVPWALLRISAPTYARLPGKDKLAWHARLTAALNGLGAESMLLGIAAAVEPTDVVAAMVAGTDVDRHPRWAAEALGALDELEGRGVTYHRAHYLCVALPAPARAALGAGVARVGARFRLAPLPVPARDATSAARAAAEVERGVAGLLGADAVSAATETEIRWLYARAAHRGGIEPSPSAVGGSGLSLVALGDHLLVEGGDDNDVDRPRHRRYVRVETEGSTSYQSFAVVADMPRSFAYPDGKGELLHRLGDLGFPLDWCVRVRPLTNADAQRKITGQNRQLSGQFEEYDGDPPDSVDEAMEANRGELGELARNPSMPELHVTIIVAIGARSLAVLEERYAAARAALEANEYGLPRPTGDQRALWATVLPGAPMAPVCGDYTQFMLARDLAGLAPFAGASLGDDRGALLGRNLDAGDAPVLFWAGTGPNRPSPVSGSIGMFGPPGGGKSHCIKRVMTSCLAHGDQVLVTMDRSDMAEYVRLAPVYEAMGYSTQVIEVGADPVVSFDPLGVFATVDDKVLYATGFVTLMANIGPASPEAAVLGTALRHLAERGGRLDELVGELRSLADDEPVFSEAARRIAIQVEVFSRGHLARLFFDASLPPVSLAADYIVFHAPRLRLPTKAELADRSSMLVEQLMSTALVYLIAAVSRDVAFSRRDRFCLVVCDEGHVLSNPQGEALLDSMLRELRKANGALVYGSQHPGDLRPDLAALLGSWFLFRHPRPEAAAALAATGSEATEANVDMISASDMPAGRVLLRDLSGRTGLVQIGPFTDPALAAAADTGLTNLAPVTSINRSRRRARVA